MQWEPLSLLPPCYKGNHPFLVPYGLHLFHHSHGFCDELLILLIPFILHFVLFIPFSMDQKCDKICQERSPRGSINRNLSRICQESIELDKKSFFKERKNTKRWMQTSKLLKHRSNQQVKLSKTSLKKNNAKHSISKTHTHTHTHTHTKQI